MTKLKRVWITPETYKRAKIAAAESESKLVDYFSSIVKGKEPSKKKARGNYNYNFIK